MKRPNMKKISSALKWLAEKRARIAGELLSCTQTRAHLESDLAELRSRLTFTEQALSNAGVRQERLTKELASFDQVVQSYDDRINPADIPPINAWQGRYGKRGALREFLIETLQSRAPAYISTNELELLTIVHFSMVFEHPSDRKKWYDSSFRNPLKLLASQGLIERGHSVDAFTWQVGSWRWKQERPKTLAEL